uniref:DUF4136 domain-containing protein n=1 Tax=uncultured Altererythrobacter sp. TaxID=500840 RepID=UPI00260CCC83|nr:DUF4136 domain-containing protein [uncultured Altererythrobacter sp.]
MAQLVRNSFVALAFAGLAACASIPGPSPVEVTRFHDAAALPAAEAGTVFIASAPGAEENALELSPYKSAVAQELSRLGYSEATADQAMYVAQVSADSFRIGEDGGKRGPVSVGVGGSTGSYGSGLGLGIGINLGGGGSRERVGHEMRVMIRNKEANQTIWEGRAEFTASPKSEFASPAQSATVLTEALFSEFPGNNGETVKVKAPE